MTKIRNLFLKLPIRFSVVGLYPANGASVARSYEKEIIICQGKSNFGQQKSLESQLYFYIKNLQVLRNFVMRKQKTHKTLSSAILKLFSIVTMRGAFYFPRFTTMYFQGTGSPN